MGDSGITDGPLAARILCKPSYLPRVSVVVIVDIRVKAGQTLEDDPPWPVPGFCQQERTVYENAASGA